MTSAAPPGGTRDSIIRAMANDGSFRVITAVSTSTVTGAIAAQKATGATARHFGELLTGAALVRETMAPDLRVQGILKGAGGFGSLVADAQPDGSTRGLVQLPAGTREVALGGGALLQMMRTLPTGALHQGVVEVPLNGGISAALMAYLDLSEQVVSVVAVGAGAGGTIHGGYLVQLLPEGKGDPLARMTEHLERVAPIGQLLEGTGGSPRALVELIFKDVEWTLLEERPLAFHCNCSSTRLLASLASLDRSEIVEMVEEGSMLEIQCDYCGKEYRISPEQLRGLLASS